MIFKGKRWTKVIFSQSKQIASTVTAASKHTFHSISRYKMQLLKGLGVLVIISSTAVGGHYYVKQHTHMIYHVYVGNQLAGDVNDPSLVDQFIAKTNTELKTEHPTIMMKVLKDDFHLEQEKIFNGKTDNAGALVKMTALVPIHTEGVQIIVDGKVIGIVNDKTTANGILDQIKQKYTTSAQNAQNNVKVLSADSAQNQIVEPLSSSFGEAIGLKTVEIDPKEITDPNVLAKKLVVGDETPAKYVVQQGDCISCIAQKLGVPKSLIYQNNPGLLDNDMIKIGDVLDITVHKPLVTVITEEKVTENQEIQYDTQYIQDPTLRKGKTQVVTSGINGQKIDTFLVKRQNGNVISDELIDEKILKNPVSAVIKTGTMIISGEGTGTFRWPVSSPTVTSGFGMRWGRLHKGIDIISTSRNLAIRAADNGKVIFAGYDHGGYGNMVLIDHLDGYVSRYAHLSKILTSVGQVVQKGDQIGIMGETGDAFGVHLHFEIIQNDNLQNPMKYLNK